MRVILAVNEFHHGRGDAIALFEPVDAGNVRMVQGRQHVGFPLEPCEPIGVSRECERQDLDRDLTFQLRVRRTNTCPIRLRRSEP